MNLSPLFAACTLGLIGVYACGHDQRSIEQTFGNPLSESGGGAPSVAGDPSRSVLLPARIEAEDFVRAQESDVEQHGDSSCTSALDDTVDIEAPEGASGGCSIGYASSGEWLEYDVSMPEAGAVDIALALASEQEEKSVSILVDGEWRGRLAIPPSTWWGFTEITLEGVGMSAGDHVIRVVFDTGATNLDYLSFTLSGECLPACGARTCGSDFCGGECGACSQDQECSADGFCIGSFENALEAHGALSVKGGQIVGEDGAPAQLRGVSTQWLNWEQTYAGNSENMRFMRDEWGLDVYRIANGVEGGNGYADPTVRAKRHELVKSMIQTAVDLDLYVIVDWHTHEIEHIELAKEFFSDIAQEFGHLPHIIYEPFNEPLGPGDAQGIADFWRDELKPYHQELVQTIREHDDDNLIILGTPRWSQRVDIAAADPVPGDNLAYTLHFYSCTHGEGLRSRARTALNAGAAIFVTEWASTHSDGGTAANPGVCLGEADLWHQFLGENNIGSAAWKLATDRDASSILFGAPPNGPWLDEHLTEHGLYVRGVLQAP